MSASTVRSGGNRLGGNEAPAVYPAPTFTPRRQHGWEVVGALGLALSLAGAATVFPMWLPFPIGDPHAIVTTAARSSPHLGLIALGSGLVLAASSARGDPRALNLFGVVTATLSFLLLVATMAIIASIGGASESGPDSELVQAVARRDVVRALIAHTLVILAGFGAAATAFRHAATYAARRRA